jgi:hypothetical protein
MTPLPHFPVDTPLGHALCIGVFDDTQNVEWCTFIDSTGECFWWANEHIRLPATVTNGRPSVSPFTRLSSKILAQIDRYKLNGWIKQ